MATNCNFRKTIILSTIAIILEKKSKSQEHFLSLAVFQELSEISVGKISFIFRASKKRNL